MDLPNVIESEEQLDEILSRPSPELIERIRELEGDILILGAGGKMGPTLATLALRASRESGKERQIVGASIFPRPEIADRLRKKGIKIIECDLLDRKALSSLPDCPNVIFMAGRKFGTSGNESLTWALNVYLPGLVADRFRESRIVAFSTGNVYPMVPLSSGGATEQTPPAPLGEYAQSTLGRERMFEHFSKANGTQITLIRLNYAIDLRYGVLVDVAQKVLSGEPVPVSVGAVNVIWQGDACTYALRSLELCSSPPAILNVTGPETVSVRWLASEFGKVFDRQAVVQGEEGATAYLSNASLCHELFGYPRVPLRTMIRWVAHWLQIGGESLGMPTHFEEKEGKY